MRNLIAVFHYSCGPLRGRIVAARYLLAAFAVLIATMGAEPALANTDCPPGSSAPDCAAPQTSAALTASFHGAPDAHNGKKLFTFEIRFSEDFDGLRLGALKQALQVTGGRVVDVKRSVRGENGSVTVRVRPASTGDLTITLADGIAGGGSLTVPGPATASLPEPPAPPVSEPVTPPVSEPDPQPVSVPEPVATPTPLTASFHGLPEKHDGKVMSFEIRFSEDFDGLKLTALKQALQVTGGRVVDVKRTVRGKNGSVTVRVRPASLDPVGISLPATADCAAAGAICTKAGGMLSGSASANIVSTSWGTARRGVPVTPDPLPPVSIRSISLTPIPGAEGYTWGSVVNMNSFGIWADPNGTLGSLPNTAPDFQVRELIRSGAVIFAWSGGQQVAYKKYYYAYPSGTDTSKTRVQLEIWKLRPGTSTYLSGTSADKGKLDLLHHINNGGTYTEFFKADAFLQTQGTLAQPDVTATFTGKVIAAESSDFIPTQGELIGGDVAVGVTVGGGAATMSVQLTGLKATELTTATPAAGRDLDPVLYTNQSWSGLTVTGGSFSSDTGGRKIQGSFRKQNNDGDANTDIVDTVGAVFEVKGSDRLSQITGGFVATR